MNARLPSANFNFEKKLSDEKQKRQSNLQGFLSSGGKLGVQGMPKTIEPSEGAVQGSFNRMMNIGQVGGLGGRMGELEKASMRLGEAASQRRIAEMEKEQQVKTAGIGQTAKVSEKADLESRLRQLQSRRPNLLFSQEGQSWQDEIKRLEDQIRSLG